MGQVAPEKSSGQTSVRKVYAPTGAAQPTMGSPFARKSLDLFERAGNGFGGLQPGMLTVLTPTRGGANELTNPYRENWTVYACCQELAKAVGSIPMKLLVNDDPEAAEVSPDDPLARLFASPTAWLTGMQMRMSSIINRKLTGEDVWFLADADGKPIARPGALLIDTPAQIINVSGTRASDRRDALGRIVSWQYQSPSKTTPEFPSESVLHFADYNPDDPQRGIGAAQVAMRQLGLVFQAERHQESVFRAGGPGYFLINENEVEEAQAKREQQELADRMQASSSGEPKILRGKWTVEAVPGSSKDLGVNDSMAWSRDVVCSIFGVPPPIIGILEQAKYSNMQEAWRQFWLGIAGYLRGVEDVLNTQFFPRLRDARAAMYRVKFDMSQVDALREDDSKQVELALKIAQAGIGMSLAGASEFMDLEYDDSIEGADLRVLANSFTPLDPEVADLVASLKPAPVVPNPNDPNAPDAQGAQDTQDTQDAPKPPAAKSTMLAADLTEPERRAYQGTWELRVLRLSDMRVYSRVRRFLVRYEDAQIKKLEQVAAEKSSAPREVRTTVAELESLLLLSEKEWADIFRQMLGGSIGDVYSKALSDMANELGVMQVPITDPRIQRALATQLTELVEGVNGTLAMRVKEALIRVMGEPSTMTDLRQAVSAELPALTEELRRVFGTKDARAMTIARTETGRAANTARVRQMQEYGVDEIEWVSAADDAVRESHQKLDGQKRSLGAEFKHDLRWPHDERGPAGEVINCRCVARPIIKV